jgi:hypothetical protein
MTAQTAVDLLEATIEVLRPELERSRRIKQRIRAWWSAARDAKGYGARDVVEAEFMRLARDTGLISDLGKYGDEDARHVLDWALRNLNPFDTGPLQ